MEKHDQVCISVIVPAYNTAKYLPFCLDSLAKQTMQDIEFLLIDDGSTDGSGEIMASFVRKDSRFRLITQENRGFAGARNRGLEEAQGKYIGFVDSDDWIDANMYSVLWEQVCREKEPVDIVQCAYINEYLDEQISLAADNSFFRKILQQTSGKFSGAESLLLDDGSIWNRIYNRNMIAKNDLHFDSSMTFGEDVFFYCTAVICSKKIIAIPDRFYHYRRNRPGSQVNCSDKRIFAYFNTIKGLDDFIAARQLDHLTPWINHLRLSYPSWGFERLQNNLKKDFFETYHNHLNDCGMTIYSPVAFPPWGGGLVRNMRYLTLRILHPLLLRSILRKQYTLFKFIVSLRKNLARLPLFVEKVKKNTIGRG